MTSNKSVDISEFERYVKSIEKSSFADEASRARAALAARSLFYRLESPNEKFSRRGWVEPAHEVALKIGCDVKLFEALGKDGGNPKSTVNLASTLGVPELTLRRVCKHLAATEVINEVGENLYTPTDYSDVLNQPNQIASIDSLFGGWASGMRALPAWLAEHNYEAPDNANDCPWQLAIKEPTPFFDWLAKNPKWSKTFNDLAPRERLGDTTALDIYPVKEKLLQDFQGGVLFVDVGGNVGQEIERFRQKYSIPDGELILQDLENVVANAKVHESIKTMAIDIFKAQPVRGPKAFHMARVLHDWSDKDCHKILTITRSAMKPGYTKLLLSERVVPATSAAPHTTGVDLMMMSIFGSRERTEKDWKQLIEGAGLKLERIWSQPGVRQCLIEATLEA